MAPLGTPTAKPRWRWRWSPGDGSLSRPMRWDAARWLHAALLLTSPLLVILSYAHLATPACIGEPHSLPHGPLLEQFPCSAGALTRGSYLLTRAPRVLAAMLRIRFPDDWVSWVGWLVLARLALLLLLPGAGSTYDTISACLQYTARLAPLIHHLGVRGCRAELSWRGRWYFYESFVSVELFSFLAIRAPVFWVEGLHSCVVLAGLCAVQHCQGQYEASGVGLVAAVWLLLRAALAPAVNLYMCSSERLRLGPHAAGGGLSGGPGGAPAGGSSASCSGVGGGAIRQQQQWHRLDGGQLSSCAEKLGVQAWEAAAEGRDAREAAAGGTSVSDVTAQPDEVRPHTLGVVAAGEGTCTESRQPTTLRANTLGQGVANTLGQAAAQEDVQVRALATPAASLPEPARQAAVVRPPVLPPYRAFIRRRSSLYKIDGYTPDEVPPGYEQRLAAMVLAAGGGRRLGAVYLRSGCVEVLLETEEWGRQESHLGMGVGSCSGREDPAASAAAEGAQSGLGLWTDLAGQVPGGQEEQPGPGSDFDLAAVIRALQLPEDMEAGIEDLGAFGNASAALDWTQPGVLGGGQSAVAGAGGAGGALAEEREAGESAAASGTTAVQHGGAAPSLGSVSAAPPGSPFASLPQRPPITVLKLQPRVLLLHPPCYPPAPGAGTGQLRHDPLHQHLRPAAPSTPPCASVVLHAVVSCASSFHLCGEGAAHGTAGLTALVRSAGRYLLVRPCRVEADGSGGGAGTACDTVAQPDVDRPQLLALELVELPPQPGLALVDFRWCGQLCRVVPLLMTADPDTAAVLGSAAAAWPYDPSVLDALLLDYGTWEYHTSQNRQVRVCAGAASLPPTRATPTCAEGGSRSNIETVATSPSPAPTSTAGGCTSALEAVAATDLAMLGRHLLRYAEAAGWHHTAARIRDTLPPTAGVDGGGGATATAVGSGAAALGSCHPPAQSPPAHGPLTRRGGTLGADPELWRSALLLALGLRRAPPADEAVFDKFAEPWILAHAQIMHVMDLVLFLATLLRPDHYAFSRANAGPLAGMFLSMGVLLLRPLMPARLVMAYRLPRYLFFMAVKGLLAFGVVPPPPFWATYALGSGMLLTEGVMLPASALLPPVTAVLAHTALQILTGCSLLRLGVSPATALAAGVRIVLAGTLTTVVGHTLLRACFACHQSHLALLGTAGAKHD